MFSLRPGGQTAKIQVWVQPHPPRGSGVLPASAAPGVTDATAACVVSAPVLGQHLQTPPGFVFTLPAASVL